MNPGIHRGLFRERFMISTRISPIALAVSSAIVLSACGGGGGGGSSSTTASPTSVTVTPSLGKFTTDCEVVLLKSNGESIGKSNINSNGAATIALSGYTGAVIAQVLGGSKCKYYDESTGALADFGTGKKLSAIVDTTRTEVGINVLTNLAAARLLDGDKLAAGKTASDIQTENLSVQRMFQVSDMFAPPTPIGSASDKLAGTSEADKLALKLAALAKIAADRSTDIASLATSLANDLAADGRLDTLDAATLQGGLTDAITLIAAPSTHLAFTELATGTTLVTNVADVKGDVTKILAAGTDLQQAKTLFADLRTSLLSISNDAGTGTVDSEYALLKEDFQSGVAIDSTFNSGILLADASAVFFTSGSSDTYVYGSEGYCQKQTTTTALCYVQSDALEGEYSIELTAGNTPGTATWNITRAYPWSGGSISLSGLTGTIALGASSATVQGNLQPMTANAARTNTNITFSQTGSTQGSRSWNGSGLLDAIKADGSSAVKAEISTLSVNEAAYTAQLALVLTGPRHRFNGTLDLSGKLVAADGSNEQPKNGKLVGAFTNTVTGVKFFEGTLTASQDWTGFDPRLKETDNNYAKVTVSFDGAVFKSGNGVSLSLSGNNNAGRKAQTVSLNFKGSNTLVVTGTGTQTRTVNGDVWTWNLANEKGIKANYSNATKSGKVLKTDGTELGTISTQRVTFVDGTFESLL